MRILTEFGMGTSLRRGDYTEAAARAVRNALWRNSINAAEVFGFDKADMRLTVEIGVARPERVDVEKVAQVFPYGEVDIRVTEGGLDVPRPEGTGEATVIAIVAISVGFDMERAA
ncbi:Lin0512 family protein [Tropicibacter alexandrii]|uniref:Lin0512 family protein n=1 Tax=Tropicibacter alexandrii TaxID=2267683 RepID=UPI000EF54585|nr:Lin0512 family protein [Tropicibacter alexandrii]